MTPKTIHLQQTEILLLPEKAVYLPEFGALCLADWHLGKAAHFRKAGIPIPQPDLASEFGKVSGLIKKLDARHVILLGDVFHSAMNNDWTHFSEFIDAHAHIRWTITMGNHDIVGKDHFKNLGMQAVDALVLDHKVICTHHPMENVPENQLNIAGHVHPGCELYTASRQRFRLPCFHYQSSVLTLPAFGSLTGLFTLKSNEQNKLFPILGDEVVEVK